MKLDENDHQIIAVLRKDARKTIKEISKETSLRPSTVHQRIQKLIRDGIIERFTLKLNNTAIDENFIVFVLIEAENHIDNRLFSHSSIKEVFGVTGEYDLLLKLKFKDIQEFNDFIIDFRKKTGIKKTLTMVSTLTIKEEL